MRTKRAGWLTMCESALLPGWATSPAPKRTRRRDAITLPATNVAFNPATPTRLGNPNGLATATWFQYGTTTNYGSTTPLQNLGGGTAPLPVSASITGLSVGVSY